MKISSRQGTVKRQARVAQGLAGPASLGPPSGVWFPVAGPPSNLLSFSLLLPTVPVYPKSAALRQQESKLLELGFPPSLPTFQTGRKGTSNVGDYWKSHAISQQMILKMTQRRALSKKCSRLSSVWV